MAMRGARGDLTPYEVIPVKGENIRKNIPGVSRFQTGDPEGKSCVFNMLGMCGGRTGCVSGFVSSFWATFMYKVFSSELRIIFYDFFKFKWLTEFIYLFKFELSRIVNDDVGMTSEWCQQPTLTIDLVNLTCGSHCHWLRLTKTD